MEIPVQLTKEQFEAEVLPHLSVAKRGFATKYSLFDTFNLILYRLATGCQWRMLPVETRGMSWQTIWHHFNKWSLDGSLRRVFESGLQKIKRLLDLSVLHLDGSHAAAKKGAPASAVRGESGRRPQIFSVSLIDKDIYSHPAMFWRAIVMTALIFDATSKKSGRT